MSDKQPLLPPQGYYGQPPQQQYYPPQSQGAPQYYGQPAQQFYGQPQQQYIAPPYQQFSPPPPPAQYTEPAAYQPPSGPSISAVNSNAGSFSADASETYRDKIWAILFLVHLGLVALLAYTYFDSATTESDSQGNDATISDNALSNISMFLLVSCVTGGAFSALWLTIMRQYAAKLIWWTLIAGLVFNCVMAVVTLVYGGLIWGILLCLLCVVQYFYVMSVRGRIPFSTAILEGVVDCVKQYPVMVSLAFFFLLVQIAWMCMWVFTCGVVFAEWQKSKDESTAADDSGSTTTLTAVDGLTWVFLILSGYWTQEVIKNVLHVSVSGTTASWYFSNTQVHNPTMKSLKRALTTSFGSICLGSLLVAAIKTLRYFLNLAKESAKDSKNVAAMFCLCCVDCFIAILEDLIKKFNRYAYVQVATYGKTFMQAAKDTWELVKSKGIDGLINDNLIGGVLVFGMILGGMVTALASALYFWTSDDWALWALAGFVVGLFVVMLVMTVVDSAVVTIFVCFAEDPRALSISNPALFQAIDTANRRG